jgi:hypothetical protein
MRHLPPFNMALEPTAFGVGSPLRWPHKPPIAHTLSPGEPMRHYISIALVIFTSAAGAQEFNWKLLDGTWAESTKHQFGCRPDNLHQTFVVSTDRKTLTLRNDRRWKIGTGAEVTEYTATILKAQGSSLFIKYGPELQGIPPGVSGVGDAIHWPRNLPLEGSVVGDRPVQQCHRCQMRTVRPNPSLKWSANGMPPGPGRWYAVHFHRPGPGVIPSSPP